MSDHSSGPRALAGPQGDITDVYAFPSPQRPERLVLVMDVFPQAGPDTFFSDALVYQFRLRPVAVAEEGQAAFTVDEKEFVFACRFDEPCSSEGEPAFLQAGWCITPTGESVAFQVNDERGGSADGLRVFAGLRSEPFFMDVPATTVTYTSGQLAFSDTATNTSDGWNVLSLVVEVEVASLLQAESGSLLAVVAETVVAGKLPIRIERVGRPEIKNQILSLKNHDPINRDLEIRDLYNLDDAYHLGRDYQGAYRARMNANLAFYDGIDGKTDWPLDTHGAHPLTELLLADFLVVDVAKPYAEDSYFEIERALLGGYAHASCGGRSLNDDVMDTINTLLINAERGPRIGDGVVQATVPASRTFPYLAPPNPQLATVNGGAI